MLIYKYLIYWCLKNYLICKSKIFKRLLSMIGGLVFRLLVFTSIRLESNSTLNLSWSSLKSNSWLLCWMISWREVHHSMSQLQKFLQAWILSFLSSNEGKLGVRSFDHWHTSLSQRHQSLSNSSSLSSFWTFIEYWLLRLFCFDSILNKLLLIFI